MFLIVAILLYALIIAIFFLTPGVEMRPYLAERLTDVYFLLLIILPPLYSATYISIGYLSKTTDTMILGELALDSVLLFFTMGLISIIAMGTMAGYGCGCGECFAYVVPSPPFFTLPSVATTSALLTGHWIARLTEKRLNIQR